MISVDVVSVNFPEWYKIEKETERTIKKLISMKELAFYLKNSDEYVRRLAILRISELKLKDSIETLKEILDDRLESARNKDLAAWTIKSVSLKWNIDIFISNRLLSKYTGSEKYSDIYKVTLLDTLKQVKFEFSSSLLGKQLCLENDDIRGSTDADLKFSFSLQGWFQACVVNLISNAGRALLSLPTWLLTLCWKSLTIFAVYAAKGLQKTILMLPTKIAHWHSEKRIINPKPTDLKTSHLFSKNNYSHSRMSVPVKESPIKDPYPLYTYKPSLHMPPGNFVIRCLWILFAPIRFILKRKMISFLFLAGVYLLLAYTTTGKVMTYKYLGTELVEVQENIYDNSKEILSFTWKELEDVLGISSSTPSNTPEMQNELPDTVLKEYRITAKSGLNLRTAPDESAPKVQNENLPYGSVVQYLDQSQKDSAGRLWYYIQTQSSKTGWVSARWLEEMGGM